MEENVTPTPQSDDLLDEEIPVLSAGKKRLVRGAAFVDEAEPEEEAAPAEVVAEPGTAPAEGAPAEGVPAEESPAPEEITPAEKPVEERVAEDTREIEEIKKEYLPEHIDRQVTERVEAQVESKEEEAIRLTGVTIEDDDLRKRYQAMLDTFFRGLRDELETKSKLTMPVVSGGMGFDDAEAERVMGVLKSKFSEFQGSVEERLKDEKAEYVAREQEKQLKEAARREQREREALDQRFQSLVAKGGAKVKPGGETVAGPPPPSPEPTPPKVIPVVGLDEPKEETPPAAIPQEAPAETPSKAEPPAELPVGPPVVEEKREEAPPGPPKPEPEPVQPSESETKPEGPVKAPEIPAAPPETPAVPAAVAPKPVEPEKKPEPAEPPKPVAPAAPAPPAKPPAPAAVAPKPVQPAKMAPPTVGEGEGAKKPVMADIKTAPRLTGPVEELRSMTVKDFNRLSKDPREATLKIKDKIEMLQEQSYETKTQAIQAWQESGANKTYLEILRRSLEGKPVDEVISEMEDSDEPALTKAQFDAIMELNRDLRFG